MTTHSLRQAIFQTNADGEDGFTAASATIASGASLSGAVDLGNSRLIGIEMPAAWTAASLTFQASYDGTNYFNLYDGFGNEYTMTVDASRRVIVPFVDFMGIRHLKVRSGTSGTGVNQGAARTLNLILSP